MKDKMDSGVPISRGRRRFLAGAGAILCGGVSAGWAARRLKADGDADVFIAKADSYSAELESILGTALTELGLSPSLVRGKRVLLKPNLVEPNPDAPHINTHPAVVRAAAEVFRRWDAKSIIVAEGQGHCRDSYLVLEQSGLGDALKEGKLPFTDLNHDEVFQVPNSLGRTRLGELFLPQSLREADIIVSIPKLKTHHWAGVTLSMKNLFGVMPGIVYGWPKNVLHQAGIGDSILDIAAAVQPHLAIVDGVIGMEGDGPIMGSPKRAGVLIVGTNLAAVDATGARMMGIDPAKIAYLANAAGAIGPILERRIHQRGESISSVAQEFKLLDHPSFDVLRS